MGLLAYLLLHRQHCHSREVLAGVFWGDQSEERSRSCLSTALWRLRQVLEPPGIDRGTYLLTTPMGEVSFNWASDHWLDVRVFEDNARSFLALPPSALTGPEVREIEATLSLWTGELLEGFYEDWALRERERLRVLYLKSLSHLMTHYSHHLNYEEGLACGARILRHDPLREEVHRAMMRLYLESGQRTLAIHQYRTCCQILKAELGIPPLEETQDLYARIIQGHALPRKLQANQPIPEPPEVSVTLASAIQELHSAMQEFQESAVKLQQAIRILEQVARPASAPAHPQPRRAPAASLKD
jgi:DNA-binding SARP family transcriptional activator